MATKTASKKATSDGTRGGLLKAPPIVVYPFSQEQRDGFEVAAVNEGMKLSPFVLHCVKTFIETRRSKR
jgi:hypothetical protein